MTRLKINLMRVYKLNQLRVSIYNLQENMHNERSVVIPP